MTRTAPFDPDTFLARHWQRAPLLLRAALPVDPSPVDGDTLAGIACEPEAAARLVSVDPAADRWQCEDGPFDASRFASLPDAGWTLLVQAVDQWIPEVAALLGHFDFLPRWRLDDVMVSYAADGGGVGPHFDQYDVFLLQLEGQRRWQLGQRCDAHTALRRHPSLKLLAAFEAEQEMVLAPGDMLYLPPGVAHQGTALGGDCITASIGFRSPSHAEVLQLAMESWLASIPEQSRYADVPDAIDPDPFLINESALGALRDQVPAPDVEALVRALPAAFGRLVTEPRHPSLIEAPEPAAATAIRERLARPAALSVVHHPASRFAWQMTADGATLYADGEAHATTAALARGVCHGHLAAADLRDAAARELLGQLLLSGSLLLAD